jgi:hypothetical protein
MLISKKYTEDALKKFIKEVVSESKENLSTKGINASGDLSKSIKGNVNVGDNSIELTIEAQDYLKFIDKGVAGVKGGRSLAGYAYTNKKPPVRFLQTWLKQKSGKFRQKNQRSIAFAIQNKIFNYGIKPTEFFTKPFESAFERLPDDLVKAYALDLEDFIEFTLKD